MVERTFEGSLPSFLAHFIGGKTIFNTEADELKALIVTVPEEKRVDLKILAEKVDSTKLSFASPDRTADYVLKDHENVIRVFIHAPKQYCMKRVMEIYGDIHSHFIVNAVCHETGKMLRQRLAAAEA